MFRRVPPRHCRNDRCDRLAVVFQRQTQKVELTLTMNPESYRPASPAEFIGDAHRVVTALGRKIERLKSGPKAGQRWLFLGDPGIGKSAAALALASMIAGSPASIEHVNGQSCTVDLVRHWRDSLPYRPMFGDSVKLIDELDLASPAAQNELLTVLDRLPGWTHVIATTNKTLEALVPRLQTRFSQFPFSKPSAQDIADLLTRFTVPPSVASRIASGATGNVRAALLDAQAALDLAA